MGRQLRIFLPGYAYHIIVRGNERKNIFKEEADFNEVLKIFSEAAEKYQFTVLSYVLMNNHYHFLAEIKLPNMSKAMQFINTSYALYFNKRYHRSGHLLQSRYKSIIVEHGQNLKYVTAYIHLNPARAGMVDKLLDYPWSSHRQYTGGVSGGLAKPEYVLKYFSNDRRQAIDMYEKYLEQNALELDDEKKAKIYADYVMGSEDFVREIKLMFKDKKLPEEIKGRKVLRNIYNAGDIIEHTSKFYEINKDELLYKKGKWNKGKSVLMYLLARDAGMSFTAIGKLLGGLSSASIGRIYKKIAGGYQSNVKIKKIIGTIVKGYTK
jgi:putative transposase